MQNMTVDVPLFQQGTTDPVVVTATKLDTGQPARFRIAATDMAGIEESDIQVVDDLAVARTRDVDGQRYAIWCDPRVPMRVDVYAGSDETLIDALVAGLEIRSGPPDGPGAET